MVLHCDGTEEFSEKKNQDIIMQCCKYCTFWASEIAILLNSEYNLYVPTLLFYPNLILKPIVTQ